MPCLLHIPVQVDGKCADLWAAFRAWCAETFSSTEDMAARSS